jgi:hypothetical protein
MTAGRERSGSHAVWRRHTGVLREWDRPPMPCREGRSMKKTDELIRILALYWFSEKWTLGVSG